MLDGAALGTLIIGLDHARDESPRTTRAVANSTRRTLTRPSAFRIRLAIALRSTADRLDRPSLGSASS